MEKEEEVEEKKQREFLQALEALKAASKDIETNSDESDSPSMKALLELETGSLHLFNNDPKLTTLSSLLSRLKSLASSIKQHHHRRPRRRRRRCFCYNDRGKDEISRVAGSIGSEIQSWIDRKSIHRFISSSSSSSDVYDQEKTSDLLLAIESRLSQGFDRSFQDLLLKSNVFSAVESLLANPNSSARVRDRSASAILSLVHFNKHVFVGEVLMGTTVGVLVSIASPTTIGVLNGLISSIRSPLIDELHAGGGISRIIALLSSPPSSSPDSDSDSDSARRIVAFDTVLEIGYYGRKEAVDAMLDQGLIEILVELQRSETLGGTSMEREREQGGDEEEDGGKEKRHPFASCVSRFSIQLEVGEGLRQRERRALKLEVLRRVREAVSISEADGATIFTEVLWGPVLW